MHLQMIGLSIVIAIAARVLSQFIASPAQRLAHRPAHQWSARWTRALAAFVAPPLLLLTTAIAIVVMGFSSSRHLDGQLSYLISFGFILSALALWAKLSWLSLQMRRHAVHNYPIHTIQTADGIATSRCIDSAVVYCARVGLWSSELVLSQGLLDCLDEEHLHAVVAHEAGHAHYRDTFWFLWLGGLRRLTRWLPYTEALWQELMLLREIRADRWAAKSVDALVLAESLLSVIQAPLTTTEEICPGFSWPTPQSRLNQRVDALLGEDVKSLRLLPEHWLAVSLSLTPLLTIPFHY
ncbi:M56 family metallopeptidase [cf. Phormidesmis sp. LEGE 11477]|uniref:M56 family metallopeptidase n=1 Tax=cf. Phormidesmis sp. LEGE 11477 TaxID=1828680 RepID=UPI001D15B098|nr:M56 family metallopeptidase [cf. Phormidesmis sp. LEGE 11477]